MLRKETRTSGRWMEIGTANIKPDGTSGGHQINQWATGVLPGGLPSVCCRALIPERILLRHGPPLRGADDASYAAAVLPSIDGREIDNRAARTHHVLRTDR